MLAAALLVCLLLIWAQLDDPVAEFSGAVPLALACAVPLVAVPFRRLAGHLRARRGEPAAPPPPWRGEARVHGYDLALVVAAVASFGLTQLFIKAINSAGGYYLHAIPAKSQISHWSTIPSQVKTFGQNLMYLFGANFWIKPQVLTNFAYLHLVGVAVALVGLVVALWSWPRADRVTRTLVIAVLAVFAAGAISPLSQPISGAHEIAIILPLSAALAGRVIGPWLAGPLGWRGPAVRMAVACVLVVAGVGYGWNLGYNASKRSNPAVDQSLADWLVAHHLTSGIGGYWDANVTALDSGGKVTIAPLVDAARYGYLWEAKTAWFDPRVSSANFAIAHVQPLGAGYLFVPTVIHHYGKPEHEYHLGRTVVMVYDYNLLTRVIQPTPDHLYGPPKVAGAGAPSPAGASAPSPAGALGRV